MRRERTPLSAGAERPAWFLAATLPRRVPRCSTCGRPALEKLNRVASVLVKGVQPDESDWIIGYRHRLCEAAPSEVALPCDDTARIPPLYEHQGDLFVITAVHYIEKHPGPRAPWLIVGVRQRNPPYEYPSLPTTIHPSNPL